MHPLLKPGSIPRIVFPPAYGDRRRFSRFSAKIDIENFSLFSIYFRRTSFETEGRMSRLRESSAAFPISSAKIFCFLVYSFFILPRNISSFSASTLIESTPSFSPRRRARILCGGSFDIADENE
ncbi:MAG TPA: hypothetical protein PKV85_09650 [Spirochaetota bacterium]|nr:hypothetical protein [Spirochaetota bacterium]